MGVRLKKQCEFAKAANAQAILIAFVNIAKIGLKDKDKEVAYETVDLANELLSLDRSRNLDIELSASDRNLLRMTASTAQESGSDNQSNDSESFSSQSPDISSQFEKLSNQ